MGYTHYWHVRPKDLPAIRKRLPSLVADFRRLLPHLPPLAGPLGEGEPVLGPSEVAFNGLAPEDYESFHFPPAEDEYRTQDGLLFAFCKTERRPYDLAVTAFLTLARWHLGKKVQVTSDGGVRDWTEATTLVERKLGYPVDPFWVLDRKAFLVEDARGQRFYTEWPRKGKQSPNPLKGLLGPSRGQGPVLGGGGSGAHRPAPSPPAPSGAALVPQGSKLRA